MLYDPLEQGSANCAHRAPEALTCCLWVLHTLQAEVSACDWGTYNLQHRIYVLSDPSPKKFANPVYHTLILDD